MKKNYEPFFRVAVWLILFAAALSLVMVQYNSSLKETIAPLVEIKHSEAPYPGGAVESVISEGIVLVKVKDRQQISWRIAHSRGVIVVGDEVTIVQEKIYCDGAFYSQHFVAKKK